MVGEIFILILLLGFNEIEPKCSGTMIIYLVFEFSCRKGISEDGDLQRLMLYAGADHVLHKVCKFMIILGFLNTFFLVRIFGY
jgi:hypothetical protein